ncbi:MAG: hypothetical protein Q8O94_02835 [bacterium]|nr:hypothetical protein [bacterium]
MKVSKKKSNKSWEDFGFTRFEIIEWRDIFSEPAHAYAWYNKGYTPAAAAEAYDVGYTAETAPRYDDGMRFNPESKGDSYPKPMAKAYTSILNEFEDGTAPNVVAEILFEWPNVPSKIYSLNNKTLLFEAAAADARGVNAWRSVGREVKSNAEEVYIWAPSFAPVKDDETKKKAKEIREAIKTFLKEGMESEAADLREALKEIKGEKFSPVGFHSIPLYDREDTEGEPLPPLETLIAPPPNFIEVAQEWGIKVTRTGFASKARGFYSHTQTRIVLATPDQRTFLHELSHAAHDKVLRKRGRTMKGGQDWKQEVVAEFTAAVIGRYLGVDFAGNSYRYIKSYRPDAFRAVMDVLEDVEACMNEIYETAERIGVLPDVVGEGEVRQNRRPLRKGGKTARRQAIETMLAMAQSGTFDPSTVDLSIVEVFYIGRSVGAYPDFFRTLQDIYPRPDDASGAVTIIEKRLYARPKGWEFPSRVNPITAEKSSKPMSKSELSEDAQVLKSLYKTLAASDDIEEKIAAYARGRAQSAYNASLKRGDSQRNADATYDDVFDAAVRGYWNAPDDVRAFYTNIDQIPRANPGVPGFAGAVNIGSKKKRRQNPKSALGKGSKITRYVPYGEENGFEHWLFAEFRRPIVKADSLEILRGLSPKRGGIMLDAAHGGKRYGMIFDPTWWNPDEIYDHLKNNKIDIVSIEYPLPDDEWDKYIKDIEQMDEGDKKRAQLLLSLSPEQQERYKNFSYEGILSWLAKEKSLPRANPMLNFHSARLQKPKKGYKRYRWGEEFGESGIYPLWDVKELRDPGGGLAEDAQAIRFDASKWTPSEAKEWLQNHGVSWIMFEEAT